ncbi:MAG: AraC family transcriptional regulator [Bacteroidales bacterium]|nr:AraC family transcriptional regulator [Bacteroidales bacterium]
MNPQELMLQSSPACVLAGKVTLVLPSEFEKLVGRDITGCHLFILVSQGKLQVVVNGKEHEMPECSLLDMMDWADFRVLHASADLRAYCLLPGREFTNESLANFKPCPDSYLVNRFYSPVLSLSREECEILERQFLLLASALGNPTHCYRQELACVYFKSFMLELGNIAFARLKGKNALPSALSKRDVVMVSFIRLVRQHFRTEHLVDFYANELGISSKHLSRIIKEVMGKTPHDVICHELIQYAMTLLKADKFSIQGIAADLHFSDQASFCKFFKKWTGMTPGEYRVRN